MFRNSLFLVLGLMVTFALGCEKKEESPADAAAAATQEAGDAAADAADGAADAVEDAAEAVEDAAEEVKDAAGDIKVPGQ